MRRLAVAISCLAIGAVFCTASAVAAPVGMIEEFDVDGWAYSLTPGPGGDIWFSFDRDPVRVGDAAVGRINSRGKTTFFRRGLDRRSALGNMAVGSDGNLWFADRGKRPAIGRITPQGQITEFRTGLSPQSKPGDLVLGPDGNVWFTDGGATPAIGRIAPSGEITEFSAGLSPESAPGEIVAGADGNLWFNNLSSAAAIGRITPAGTITEFGPGPPSGSVPPFGPVLGPDGNVWFVISSFKSIGFGRITPQGAISGFGGLSQQTLSVGPLAAGPDGNVWFAARGREEYDAQGKRVTSGFSTAVGRVTPSGEVTAFGECLHTGPQYTGPNSIAAGPDGNVWFTNLTTRSLPNVGTPPAIGRITPGGKITEYRAGLQYASTPDGIVAGPDGALWFHRSRTSRDRPNRSQQCPAEHLPRPAQHAGGKERRDPGTGRRPRPRHAHGEADRPALSPQPADQAAPAGGGQGPGSGLRQHEGPPGAEGRRPEEAAPLRLHHAESEGHLCSGGWIALRGIRLDPGRPAPPLS